MELTRADDAVGTLQRPRLRREDSHLVGSRCRACGTPSWPSRTLCHHCGSDDVEDAAFPPAGVLVSHTTVWVSRPGLEAPYTLGEVALEGGVNLYAHVRGLPEEAKVPVPVRLVLGQDNEVPAFWFEPDPIDGTR